MTTFTPAANHATSPPIIPKADIDPGIEIASAIFDEELAINEALPGLVRGEATVLILDVNNLYRVALDAGFKIDYLRLREIFSNRCDLRLALAYSAVKPGDADSAKWVNLMRRNGYSVITKDLINYVNRKGHDVVKGNMDVEITLAATKLNQGFAHIVLGTCDGSFIPLVKDLRSDGFRKVSVLGIKKPGSWNDMSEELAKVVTSRHGDSQVPGNFYNMVDLLPYVAYGGRNNEHPYPRM